MNIKRVLYIMGVGGILSACGVAPPNPILDSAQNGTHYKVGSSYTIYGIRYTPREDYTYSEIGTASWYGPKFHGKKTANGAIFDQHSYTAAHRTLPLPSLVRVTNLENAKTIVLTLNDRGPYAKGRIIDLSYAAAKYLGFIRNGIARVKVEILPTQSKMLKSAMLGKRQMPKFDIYGNEIHGNTPKFANAPPIPNGHYVQVGVYSDLKTAIQQGNTVKTFGRTKIYKTVTNNKSVYAVRLGPYPMKIEAQSLSSLLQDKGIHTIIKKY